MPPTIIRDVFFLLALETLFGNNEKQTNLQLLLVVESVILNFQIYSYTRLQFKLPNRLEAKENILTCSFLHFVF